MMGGMLNLDSTATLCFRFQITTLLNSMKSNPPRYHLNTPHPPPPPPSSSSSLCAERKLRGLIAHLITKNSTIWDLPSVLNDIISDIDNLTWEQAFAFATLFGEPVKPPVGSKQDVIDAIDDGFKKHFKKLEESKASIANETESVWGYLLRNDPVGLDNMLKEYPSFDISTNDDDVNDGNGGGGSRPGNNASAPLTPSSPRGRFGFFCRSLKKSSPSTPTTDPAKQQGEMESLLMDRDDDGRTVLHAAVLLGYLDCIHTICDHANRGIGNPNKLLYAEKGVSRSTPMRYCLTGKSVSDTLELLLAEGIDLFVLPSDVNEGEKKETRRSGRRGRRTDDTDPFYAGIGDINENGEDEMEVGEHDEREEEEGEEEWRDAPPGDDDEFDEEFIMHMYDPSFMAAYYKMTGWEELISTACNEPHFIPALKKVLNVLSSQSSSFDINKAVPTKAVSSEVKEITAMQLAAHQTNLDVIDLLMSYGAKVDIGCVVFAIKGMKAADPYAGMYPDDEEAEDSKKPVYLQIMDTLVRSGVDLNEQFGKRKETPLLQATRTGNKMIVDYLLQKRVSISPKDYAGRNAATLAEEKGFEELAEMLKKSRQLSRLFSSNSGSSRREGIKEGEGEGEEVPREEACICCLERRKEVIFAPCGHRLVCRRCFRENVGTSEAMQKCMVCKESIVSWILKVYE